MTWIDAGNGKQKCTRHDPKGAQLFGPKQRCLACDADPGPIVVGGDDLAAPPAAPAGCLTAVEHERKLTELAEFIEDKSRKLCTGKGRINYATAFKGFELAIKAYNAASLYTQTRERRAHVAKLERRRREMHGRLGRPGRGGSN